MSRASVLFGLAGAATLAAIATPLRDQTVPVPEIDDVRRLEAKVRARLSGGLEGFRFPADAPQVPPDRARPLDQYVRHYAFVTRRSEEDLPFTTIDTPSGDPEQAAADFTGRRIAGVLVLESVIQRPTGIVPIGRHELPRVFHGGCAVVNVVYDPEADRLVSAWCNVN